MQIGGEGARVVPARRTLEFDNRVFHTGGASFHGVRGGDERSGSANLRCVCRSVEKAHAWFRRAGHWSLTIGYFIPGVRHFTAYAAGMSDLEAPTFAAYADRWRRRTRGSGAPDTGV